MVGTCLDLSLDRSRHPTKGNPLLAPIDPFRRDESESRRVGDESHRELIVEDRSGVPGLASASGLSRPGLGLASASARPGLVLGQTSTRPRYDLGQARPRRGQGPSRGQAGLDSVINMTSSRPALPPFLRSQITSI